MDHNCITLLIISLYTLGSTRRVSDVHLCNCNVAGEAIASCLMLNYLRLHIQYTEMM